MTQSQTAGVWIQSAWDRCRPLPFGRWIFSRFLGVMVPYTGSMRPRVVELEPGFAVVELDDRRAVRNHLQSIHAVAIANLAELTGNLALASALHHNQRFIVRSLTMEYLKKARGTISARCECVIPGPNSEQDLTLHVRIEDQAGVCVAKSTICSKVGLLPVRS